MKIISTCIILLLTILSIDIEAQVVLADFETATSTPTLSPTGVNVIDNPDKSSLNPSSKVGFFNKPSGDWSAFYLVFSTVKNFGTNNTDLTFKIRSDFAARVYVKVWNGSQVVSENWAPNYNFMVTAGVWTDCIFDISTLSNKDFTRLEININGGSSSGKVYFDDFKMTNPLASNGLPVASFKTSKPKAILGDTVVFDASASYDFNGSITSYKWDFQDGTTDTGKIVAHKFAKDGIFRVKLTIQDNENNSASIQNPQNVYPVNSKLGSLNIVSTTPSVNSKVEGWFLVNNTYTNVYNPDEVKVDALITLPDQKVLTVPCFYYMQTNYLNSRWRVDSASQFWAVRFTSTQVGVHKITLRLTDTQGTISNTETSVTLQANAQNKGIIKTDAQNKQFYRRTTGEPFYPQGINVAWNSVENYAKIIGNLSSGGANYVRYWHAAFNQQQLEWKNNGFNKGLGVYSQGAAAMQDSILDLCTQKNMNLQMCIFHHGMFSENVNSNWNDNPYNIANGGSLTRAEEFFYNAAAKAQAKKLLRYIVARWGYSSNLFAWELFNEVNFTGMHNSQTATWRTEVINWHNEMGQYIKTVDPFKHIVTTSADDNQLRSMDGLEGLDNVQYHTYNNNILDELSSKDASFLSNLSTKSIICGEYGTNNNADVPFETQRHAIWTGISSQVPHIMWLWDNYTDASWSTLFKQPTAFMNNEDFTKEGTLSKWNFSLNSNNTGFKTSGFSTTKNNFYGYAYDVLNQNNLNGIKITVPNIPKGTYRIQYYMPDSARAVVVDSVPLTPLSNTLILPTFSKGLGIKIQFLTEKLVGNKELVINSGKMMAYPNPVTDNLTLEFETGNSDKAMVQVMDMYGRMVKSSSYTVLTAQEVKLNMTFDNYLFPSGVYLIQITNGNKVFMNKVVYQKK
jgi:PKD domain/Secretion system C-terminal sorting domain